MAYAPHSGTADLVLPASTSQMDPVKVSLACMPSTVPYSPAALMFLIPRHRGFNLAEP